MDPELCTRCGKCIEVCPETYPDPVQGGVMDRKAIGPRGPLCSPSDFAIDWEHCTKCGECVTACPEKAVNLEAGGSEETRRVKAVVLATGFKLYDPAGHPEFGHGRFKDVVTTLELERLIAKSAMAGEKGLKRPSDGQPPSRIAWIQCVGSREAEHNYCSSVCCMISLKEARHCRELMPDAHLELFYMDLRTCGKGYEHYLNDAENKGIKLTRGRPGEVLMKNGGLALQVERDDGSFEEEPFDLVVLSVGFEAPDEAKKIAEMLGIPTDEDGFLIEEMGSLSRTGREGVYVAGAAAEPRDIPEAVMQAHEAAALAAVNAEPAGKAAQKPKTASDPTDEDLKILVTLCDCSGTMAGMLDWEALKTQMEGRTGVAEVQIESHLCRTGGLEAFTQKVSDGSFNAVLAGACTPRWLHPILKKRPCGFRAGPAPHPDRQPP